MYVFTVFVCPKRNSHSFWGTDLKFCTYIQSRVAKKTISHFFEFRTFKGLLGLKPRKTVIFGQSLTPTVLKLLVWNFKYKPFGGFPRKGFFRFLIISCWEPLPKKMHNQGVKERFPVFAAVNIHFETSSIVNMWIRLSKIFII